MKKYLGVLILLLTGVLVTVVGLALIAGGYWAEPEPTGEEWCELMMAKANPEWTDAETRSFAKICLYN